MKSKRLLSILLLVLLPVAFFGFQVIPLVKAIGVNQLENPGFETGDWTGWNPQLGGSYGWIITTYAARSGIYGASTLDMNVLYTANFNPPINVKNVAECTFWLLTSDSTQCYFTVVCNDTTSTTYPSQIGPGNGQWEFQNFTAWINSFDASKFILCLGVNRGTGSGYHYTCTDDWTLSIEGVDLSADLENIDDFAADWVFTEWRYYTFTASIPSFMYSGDLDIICMRFYLPIWNGTASCGLWEMDDEWHFETNFTAARELQPIRTKAGSLSNDTGETNVTFPIWFTGTCLDVYDADEAVDVEMAWNDTTGVLQDWLLVADGFFRVYSKGGFSLNTTTTGTAFPVIGGETFALYAENNSYVYRDQWFRDVQHMKLLPEIQAIAGYQTFYLTYGIDYSLGEGEWLHGMRIVITPDAVSWSGIFAANVWVNMTVAFQNGQGDYWNGTETPDNSYLYMFYHGEAGSTGQYVKWKMWIDEWFNAINASSTIAGRVNAYEFPMKDGSAVWLRWLSSEWGVKDDVDKEDMVLFPLLDKNGNRISSERIQMIKYWSELEVPSDPDYNQKVLVDNFDVVDLTYSRSLPLTGIQTPVFDETKMPVVGNSGILGALWSMFAGIGQWIGDNILFGGLALWPTFVNFMDTIASWLGMPNGFTNLMSWLGGIWSGFVSGVTYLLSLIYNFFLLLGQLGAAFVYMLGEAVSSIITFLGYFVSFMAGGYSVGVDLWNTLGITTWISVFLVFYPVYLIILWDQKGYKAVIDQLMFIWGIVDKLGHFLFTVLNTMIGLISGLVESVPVVE